jgi:plastocyanin
MIVGRLGVVLTGLMLLGCPPGSQQPPEAEFAQVDIRNSAFVPRDIAIKVGQTVRWTNEDPVFHTVTSGNPGDPDAGTLFDSHDLIPFDSFRHTFNQAGVFVYHSKLDIGRPGMVGATVTVTE